MYPKNSAKPEVRGTAEYMAVLAISHHIRLLVRPLVRPLGRPQDYYPYFAADGRAETDSFIFYKRGRRLRIIVTRFDARGVFPAVGTV